MDFDGESPFKRHGALSYYLTNELTRAVPGTTHRDVFEIAGAEVTKHFRTQHPQIEGVLDREIFGSRVMRPMRYLPLLSVDGDTAMLGGGGIHDLRAGSEWDVYPRGTKDTEAASCVGRIELDDLLADLAVLAQTNLDGPLAVLEAGGSGQIDAVGRYRRVLALEHEASELDVAFETFRVARDGSLEAAGAPEFEFVEGDRLAFEVTNNENTILFFSILSFGLDGAIGRLYPRGKSSEMISANSPLCPHRSPSQTCSSEDSLKTLSFHDRHERRHWWLNVGVDE